MAYRKLSEQLEQLNNPQRSDAFVRLFREAVRVGTFDAMVLPERIALPKLFKGRGTEGPYQKNTVEMLFEPTPEFEAWFEQTNRVLTPVLTVSRVRPSLETVEAGLVDFKTMAADTRLKMQAKYERGQRVGQSRAQSRRRGR